MKNKTIDLFQSKLRKVVEILCVNKYLQQQRIVFIVFIGIDKQNFYL